MNYLWSESFPKYSSSSSLEQDILIKTILLSHDPDGHDHDTEMWIRVIETIMHHATASQVSVQQQETIDMSSIEVHESQEHGNSIYKLSCEILCKCYGEENVHASTLSVLKFLGSHRWDSKLLLALTAFATVYGEFWVIKQSQNESPLAASIALLKQLPNNFNTFKPIFKALTTLVNIMIEVIRCVTQFEGLPIAYAELDDDIVTNTKSLIYVAAYWVVKSIMVCINLVTNLGAIKDDQGFTSISISVWEITSLKSKIKSIGTQLRTQVDACQKQIEQKMHKKVVKVFRENHFDNQEVLWMLFALKNDLPLKQSSEHDKLGISSLKNKVVILLISKPELLPVEELLFLVQQTYDHPLHKKLDGSYEIVWIPISPSKKWNNNEIKTFSFLSNSLPWYSIRQPWLLSTTTINYAKQEWNFNEKPIMVVLDSTGRVTNVNSIDTVWIWGEKAYPFSISKETELWKEEKWSLKLLLDGISPLLTMWAEEGRTICIYGSNKLDWIREFSAKIKDIQCHIPKLEVVYVGKKDSSALASNIVSIIDKEKLSNSLSLSGIYFFWCRLESMRRSKLKLGQTTDTDITLKEVEALLVTCENENNEDWIIIGSGFSANIVKLQGDDWIKFLVQYPVWRKHLPRMGLVDAIRISLEQPATEPCSHSRIIRYNEGLMEEIVVCEKCKRPMEKFIIYDVV